MSILTPQMGLNGRFSWICGYFKAEIGQSDLTSFNTFRVFLNKLKSFLFFSFQIPRSECHDSRGGELIVEGLSSIALGAFTYCTRISSSVSRVPLSKGVRTSKEMIVHLRQIVWRCLQTKPKY